MGIIQIHNWREFSHSLSHSQFHSIFDVNKTLIFEIQIKVLFQPIFVIKLIYGRIVKV